MISGVHEDGGSQTETIRLTGVFDPCKFFLIVLQSCVEALCCNYKALITGDQNTLTPLSKQLYRKADPIFDNGNDQLDGYLGDDKRDKKI